MTLEVTTRPFSPEEKQYLASWRAPGFGFAVAAAWLLIVPVVVAGIISFTMILAGVSLGATLAISYAFGLAFGIFGLWRQYGFFRQSIERHAEAHRRAREQGMMSTISFTPSRAWDVDGLGDFGPGYVFDTGTDQCVYLSGPELPHTELPVFPARAIAVAVIPEINEIHDLRLGPGTTSIEDVISRDRLGVEFDGEARSIPLAHVLAALQAEQLATGRTSSSDKH